MKDIPAYIPVKISITLSKCIKWRIVLIYILGISWDIAFSLMYLPVHSMYVDNEVYKWSPRRL